MKSSFLLVLFLLILLSTGLNSQQKSTTYCRPCQPPCLQDDRDSVMDVFMGDESVIRGVSSAVREIISQYGVFEQGIRLYYYKNNICRDTLVLLSSIKQFEIAGIGGTKVPLAVHIRPVREFFQTKKMDNLPNSFLEITGNLGYGGKDTSTRKIGFNSLHYGAEVLIAPLGSLLGENIAIAVGGGLFSENSRLRFPVMGHIRWTFLGTRSISDSLYFKPGPCRFQCSESDIMDEPGKEYTERMISGSKDSSAYLIREKYVRSSDFRPFFFAEGGFIFDSKFDGSGKDPSENPSDYGEYFFGGGVGTPLFNWLTVSLGYRYMRLIVRTPCPKCTDRWVVNTNNVHSIMLKAGFRLEW